MNFYVLYPSLRSFYILKEAERRGFNVYNLPIYDKVDILFKNSNRIKTYFKAKCLTEKEIDEDLSKSMRLSDEALNMSNYIKDIKEYDLTNLKMDKNDILISFDESMMFEAACIGKFISPYIAWIVSCKHVYYRKLNIPFKLIKTESELMNINLKDFIIKPSINGVGKRNVFRIKNDEDKKSLLIKDQEFFTYNRPYIVQEYINHVLEIWAMTFFDKDCKPHILWFSTEQGHATKSPFEQDLYKEIEKINNILKIKNWMAFMQFFILEDGSLSFCDLNARLPGDDFWHEDLYKHLTGYSFAEKVLDLLIDKKIPDVIKNNNIVVESEYDSKEPLKNNQKMWYYSDNYKNMPLLTFKKLDLN